MIITSGFDYDVNTRQGASNLVEKLRAGAGEALLEGHLQYQQTGQVWIKQLLNLVGDEVWPKLNEQQQLQRINVRAEFIEYGKAADKLEPFGKAFDVGGFGAATDTGYYFLELL